MDVGKYEPLFSAEIVTSILDVGWQWKTKATRGEFSVKPALGTTTQHLPYLDTLDEILVLPVCCLWFAVISGRLIWMDSIGPSTNWNMPNDFDYGISRRLNIIVKIIKFQLSC